MYLPTPPHALRPLVEELEPRILFSADFAPILVDAFTPQAETRLLGHDGEFSNDISNQQPAQQTRYEVVFIDQRVDDYALIVADIQKQNTDDRSIEIVLLDAERDGIAQISSFLNERREIDVIHIISHGQDGAVNLGSGQLNFDSLRQNADAIKQWSNALNEAADILIYGCELAATTDGQSLVNALAKLTGADVAASDDLTGYADLGGDYDLEYASGRIEGRVAFSAEAQQSWRYVLANLPPMAVNDNGATTEDTVLVVASPGVLANDSDPDSTPVSGATLNFNAANDNNGVWNNETAVTGFDWTLTNFGTQSTHTTSPGSAYPGITAAYRFSGTNSGATMPSFEGIAGDPTNNSASFEVWFRTDVLTTSSGQHIIFETGGVNTGLSIYLDNTFVNFAVRTNGATADEVSVNLAPLFPTPTAEFIQLVGVIDQSNNQMKLYINGALHATKSFTGSNGTDWNGPDGAGLGRVFTDVSTGPAAGSGNLDGDIAIFRFYERALTAAEATTNFSAVAGSALTVSQVQGNAANVGNQFALASGALLTLNANGAYTYNPNGRFEYLGAGQSTTDSFSYTVADAGGATATANVTITINGVNDAPTINSAVTVVLAGTDEDTTSSGTTANSILTSANWADVEAGALKGIAITSQSGAGNWQYSTDGTTWTAFGAVSSTNALLIDSATQVRYVPNGINGETALFGFKAWDRTSGAASTNASPAFANPGSGGGSSAYSSESGTASMTVTSVNDAPTATNLSAPETYIEDTPLNLTDIVVSDVDSPTVTVTLTLSTPTAGSLNTGTSGGVTSTYNASTGVWSASGAIADVNALLAALTFTPTQDFNSNFTIATRVSDGVAPAITGTKNFTGTPTNDAPTNLSPGIALNRDGGTDAYLVDNTSGVPYWQGFTGITMEFTLSELQTPASMATLYSKNAVGSASYFAIRADGTLNWTGFTSTGKYTQLFDGGVHTVAFSWNAPAGSLRFYVDGILAETRATGTQALTNGGGVFTLGQKQNSVGGGFLASDRFSGTFHDVRVWNHVRTAAEITQYNGYKLDLSAPLAAQAGLVANWQMDKFVAGKVTDTTNAYTLSVGHASGSGYTTSNPSDTPTIAENSANGTHVAYIVATDKDASESHTFSLIDTASGRFAVNATNGRITVANGSLLDYETANSHVVVVRVTDSSGLAYDEAVTINVTNVNEAPTATNLNAPETYVEDIPLDLTDIVVSDVDSPTTITVTLTLSAPAAGSLNTGTSGGVTSTYNTSTGVWNAIGAVADVNSLLAALTFTPTQHFNGNFTIATRVSDGIAPAISGSKAFTGTPVNDAPTTTPVTLTAIAEDSGARLITQAELLANASDVENDGLTAINLAITSGSGTLMDNLNGTWSYTPAANDDTGVSFSYGITDGTATTPGSATLDITPVNDAPTAANTTINATEDTDYNGNLPAAADIEGDPVTYALASQASRGIATVNADGSSGYSPNANLNGPDSFTYTVSDGNGGSNTYTVTVNVAAVNDPPAAQDDVASGDASTTIIGSVLSNDSDIDGDPLVAILVSGPANGSLTLNANGTFSYLPNAGFSGTDSFTYRAHDGALDSNVATVSITVDSVFYPAAPINPVLPVATPPVAAGPVDPATVEAGQTRLDPAPKLIQISGANAHTLASAIDPATDKSAGPLRATLQWMQDDIPSTRQVLTHPEIHGDLLLRLLEIIQTDSQRRTDSNRLSPAIHVEITQDESFQVEIISRGAQITAASLSVGAVWWALRVGGLFASLLTSMPAWRSFDLLPVLNRREDLDENIDWDRKTASMDGPPEPGKQPQGPML